MKHEAKREQLPQRTMAVLAWVGENTWNETASV